jgi:alpha-tubulin suppressor-like RCC1 family protein
VMCWGQNAEGQVGVGKSSVIVSMPVELPQVRGAKQITLGDAHTCVLLGAPWATVCWGSNKSGQLGDGTRYERDSPTPVAW